MKINRFELERWYARYEFSVPINISASCAPTTSTSDLLALAGAQGYAEYLGLSLDYIESNGTPRLRQAISSWYKSVTDDDILVTTGASEGIFLLMNALIEPGDEVVVQWPVYQSLCDVALALGAEIRRVEITENELYALEPEKIEQACTPKTKLIVINTPHSPTGSVASPEVLEKVYRTAETTGAYLLCDEVYRGIIHGASDPGAGVDLGERAISIGDMTKPFGLGGLRIGWVALHNKKLRERMAVLKDYTTMCCSAPSEYLASIALENRDKIIPAKIRTAEKNMAVFVEFCKGLGNSLNYIKPRGGFTAFVNFKNLQCGLGSEEFCGQLADQEGVLLLPGSVFGRDGYFRVGFGSRPETFTAGLAGLARFISRR